jgi:hypothetical protein
MEVTHSSQMLFHTRPTRRYITESRNVYNCRCENLKSYTAQIMFKNITSTSQETYHYSLQQPVDYWGEKLRWNVTSYILSGWARNCFWFPSPQSFLVWLITILYWVTTNLKSRVIIRPTVSRPVCPCIRAPAGTCAHFFLFHRNYLQSFLLLLVRGALSDKRTGLWFTRTSDTEDCHRCHSRVKSRSTCDHILLSHLRLCSLSVASYESQGYSWSVMINLLLSSRHILSTLYDTDRIQNTV